MDQSFLHLLIVFLVQIQRSVLQCPAELGHRLSFTYVIMTKQGLTVVT